MPCAAFEDLLSGYGELTAAERHSVDLHLAICGDCREHLETLAELDRELARLYHGLHPRSTFAASVISSASESRQPRRPSAWPEVLDFFGWAAVVAIVAVLAVTAAAQAGIAFELPPYAGWLAAAILAAAALAALRLRALPRD